MKIRLNITRTLLVTLIILLSASVFIFWSKAEPEGKVKGTENANKEIVLDDDGIIFRIESKANTVEDFLAEHDMNISSNDEIIPLVDAKIYGGSKIVIQRAKKINIIADGEEIENYTLHKSIKNAILENSLSLSDVDIVYPLRSALIYDGIEIEITRVNIEEKIVKKDIDFKVISKEDDKLGWRDKKIEQKGEKGIEEIKYEITYHNGEEISRKVLESNIIKESVTEIVVHGTYIKLGKSHKGLGTWYAYTGTMSAASPWLPMGSFVKVTNRGNGKSVIVEINDVGPFGKDRIIDLDKVAFQKIASLGAGVINVKVEEVLN